MADPASAAPRRTPRPPRLPRIAHVRQESPVNTGSKTSVTLHGHPTYWGGAVIQHVHVVGVRFGDPTTNTFLPQLSGAAPSVESFLTALPQSSYMDMLSEYGAGGQLIGRGSYGGMYTMSPNNDPTQPIDDSQIQTALDAQAGTPALPAATADTLYVLFFPEGQEVTVGGFSSFTNFCAYHGTTATDHLRYVVMPYRASDTDPTIGIAGNCGKSAGMGNFTSVLSHEFSESVTDPDVGLTASCCGPPLGWVDGNTGNEIGDICNQIQKSVKLSDGFKYVVQEDWSNQLNKCAASGPVRTLSVGDAAVTEGDSGGRMLRIPVTLSETSHFPITVNYTVAGSGANPATPGADFVDSGGTESVTIPMVSASKSAQMVDISIPIVGDAVHEADETLQVTVTTTTPGYGLERGVGTGTIYDDDPAPGLMTTSVGDTSIVVPQGKAKGSLEIPVMLNVPAAVDTSVTYVVTTSDATPADYSGPNQGTVKIKAGLSDAMIVFSVKPHLDAGADKSLTITLTGGFSKMGTVTLGHSIGTATLLRAT
jgi:hypothetical protein